MKQSFDGIISGKNQYKIGLHFGIAITLFALTSNLRTALFEFQSPYDWLFVFLVGLTIFFYFMGIALNTEVNTRIEEIPLENNRIQKNTLEDYKIHLDRFNILSKSCFVISTLISLLAFIKFIILLIKF